MARVWSNHIDDSQMIRKLNILKYFGSKETKGHKHDSQK
jgi:hypothetical protein